MLAIRHHFEHRAERAAGFNLLRRHVSRLMNSQSEGDDFPVEVSPELRNVLIVSIQHCDTARGKRLYEFVLGARDGRDRLKKLQMDRSDHGHDTTIRSEEHTSE